MWHQEKKKSPAKPQVRMVAIDMDGTLLADDKRVGSQTVRAVRQLTESGVAVVLATARPPRSVRHIYAGLGLSTLQINYNGAVIWDEFRRKPIFHRPMQGLLVRSIIDHARSVAPEVQVGCEILDHWFTDRVDDAHPTETGKLFKPDFVGPLSSFCHQEITKLLLVADEAVIAQLYPAIVAIFQGQVSTVNEINLIQIMDPRVSKAVALEKLAKHYEVDMSQVMAIGDGLNDLGMLQVAGIAVAVGNAHPRLKEVAHWIAPTNNEDGVYEALKRYAL